MDPTFQSIILGIVQGLTEFLPVSSSGHLEIAKFLLNDESLAEQSMLMTVVLHFATALSTIVVFRKEVIEILAGLFSKKTTEGKSTSEIGWLAGREELAFALKIIVSMIPAVIVGLAFEDAIESLFDRQLLLVGCMLIVTGVLLLLADRARKTDKQVGFVDAIVIGISQAIAILPGISRSGATISTSVLLGIDREKAARFSFLMVVPLIFGKIAKDLLGGDIGVASDNLLPLVAGFIAAFVTGLLACTWMIKLVKACQLSYFSAYCFVVAVLAIGAAMTM